MGDPVEMEVLACMNHVPENRRMEVQIAYQGQKKNRTTALVLSLLWGILGVDRFYLGQTGLGVLKLVTGGGCGFWAVVDWFIIMSAADTHNRNVLQRIMYAYQPPPQSYAQLPQQTHGRPPWA
jgi:TM2 domain-containing membrane protein YozV